MIKNGLIRFSLLGILLILLTSACNTPRYSHANDHRSYKSSTRYASHHTKKSRKHRSAKKHRRKHRVKKEVAAPAKLELRQSLVQSAERYLGTQYVYGGKTPNPGFDCSGFTSWVYSQHDIPLEGASHHQSRMGKKIAKEKAAPGDLMFFGSGSKVSHVAMVRDNKGDKLEVIHSTSGGGVRIDEVNHSPYWKKRYLYTRQVIR